MDTLRISEILELGISSKDPVVFGLLKEIK